MSHRGHRGHGGFTRRELLFVIIFLGIVLLILLPALLNMGPRARLIKATNTGQALYMVLFAQENDSPPGLDAGNAVSWPQTADLQNKRYADSSEFFQTLVESNVVDATYSFFAGDGTGISNAKDGTEFRDGKIHAIWCITLNVSSNTTPGTPVLFTQNFKFKSRGSDATLDQMIGLEENARLFGKNAGVVIKRGGAAKILDATTATPTNFNPTGATNRFLWPLASGQDVSGR